MLGTERKRITMSLAALTRGNFLKNDSSESWKFDREQSFLGLFYRWLPTLAA